MRRGDTKAVGDVGLRCANPTYGLTYADSATGTGEASIGSIAGRAVEFWLNLQTRYDLDTES